MKYKDKESDLVIITTTRELIAEKYALEKASLRIYISEVSPDQEPSYDGTTTNGDKVQRDGGNQNVGVENKGTKESRNEDAAKRIITVED